MEMCLNLEKNPDHFTAEKSGPHPRDGGPGQGAYRRVGGEFSGAKKREVPETAYARGLGASR
jgi:hypothetical protein